MLSDLQCFRGDVQGRIRHTFFNTGERTIDFNAGENKRFKMVCDLGQKSKGELKIIARRIYDNPDNDGKKKGTVLARDIEWKVEEK